MNGPTSATEIPRRLRLSSVALVLANLVPLAGVLLWQWSVSSIVILYWFENVVIGVINVLRMILLSPEGGSLSAMVAARDPARAAALDAALAQRNIAPIMHGVKFIFVPFFIVHYFGFCAGHGVFVFSMFGDENGYFMSNPGLDPLAALGRAVEIFSTPLALAAAVLVASHVFSFVQNYILGGEYRRLDARRLMSMPYGRIIVLHVTILAGGFATQVLGEPVWLVVVLVVMKIGVDLKMHLAEHRRAGLIFCSRSAGSARRAPSPNSSPAGRVP